MTTKQRELKAEWEKLLKEQSKPLMDKNKYGPSRMRRNTINALSDVLSRNADRLPGNGSKVKQQVLLNRDSNKELPQSKMSKDEYEIREAKAKEVKHCVMPLHKGSYILVTDPEMIKQMGKKTV